MRDIKFRQWDGARFHEWGMVDGSFIGPSAGLGIRGVIGPFNPATTPHQQFTGLHDVNGVEIYEGDIVECWGLNLVVVWEESDASFFVDSQDGGIYESGQEWGGNCVVVGNIHETPELLK